LAKGRFYSTIAKNLFRITPLRTKITLISIVILILSTILSALVQAQTSLATFEEIVVELWPEYDRPAVLVIYRATLSDATPLPATVTFRLPAYIDGLHAIAVERNGGLFNLSPENIQESREGDSLFLTLTTESPNLHLEYYDDQILSIDGQNRQINYNFQATNPLEIARFQLQVPLESEGFSVTPAPNNSFTDNNGFNYQIVETAGLAEGDAVDIEASYSRATTEPSLELLPAPAPQAVSDIQVVTDESPSGLDFQLGYLLIGAGVLLLLATGGYWWWSTHRATAEGSLPVSRGPVPKPTARGKRSGSQKSRRQKAAAASQQASYCYQCGTALRPDANFCHVCGAERRNP
jgi:hypothetical protein